MELQESAANRGQATPQLVCLLTRLQIAAMSPHPDKQLVIELLRAAEALLAELSPVLSPADGDTESAEKAALLRELKYTLTVAHVSYIVRFDDSASFGLSAEDRLRKALAALTAQADEDTDGTGDGGGAHAAGRWLPPALRLAFLHLLAARVRR